MHSNYITNYKEDNKKVTQIKRHHQLEWNCPIKTEYSLNSNCLKEDVICKCTALTTFQHKKVYLGLDEGELKKQRRQFRNKNYSNSTTLSNYVWKTKNKKKKGNTNISGGK